jgi:type I restriction enzyme M protein
MNTPSARAIVQRVWSYAHVLKDDGLAFMDYTEQITYLLFLKMAWEQKDDATGEIPSRYTWGALRTIPDNARRLDRYHQALRNLSDRPGLIGLIFTKPQSKITDPAKLDLLMRMIDTEQWSSLDIDVKGEVYEGLLDRNADDVRGGAGQYFTPRPVIRAIVQVMRPEPQMTIIDPACGTGGFLLAAFEYLKDKVVDKRGAAFLRSQSLHGVDLVPNVARLCAMNLFLRGRGVDHQRPAISVGDSLESEVRTSDKVDMVLTNPPFGKKSSFTIVGADGRTQTDKLSYERRDFWATTSNKQLNFVQHVFALLKDNGRAAVVVPDNVLFEGGAGERIRRAILETCDVHTLLRLPTGIWYSPGVKANVLFFDKRAAGSRVPATKAIWVYDLRSQRNFSLRHSPIRNEDLEGFVASYCAADRKRRVESRHFRRFTYADVAARDKASLDITWADQAIQTSRESPQRLMKAILADLGEAIRAFEAAEDIIER